MTLWFEIVVLVLLAWIALLLLRATATLAGIHGVVREQLQTENWRNTERDEAARRAEERKYRAESMTGLKEN
jgi:hypothetical protein